MTDNKNLVTVETAYSHDEYFDCLNYVQIAENNPVRLSQEEIASELGITRQGLHKMKRRWSNDGLLPAVRQIVSTIRLEQVQESHARVLAAWGDIIERQIHIARDAKSDKNANDAAHWLHEAIIKPALDAKVENGADEIHFIESVFADMDSLDPLSLSPRPDVADMVKEIVGDSED